MYKKNIKTITNKRIFLFILSFVIWGCNKYYLTLSNNWGFPILNTTESITYENLLGTVLYNQDTASFPKYTKRNWQGIPSIGIDKYHHLYITWFAGGSNENGTSIGNYITMSISNNLGRTWYKNKIVIAPSDSDSDRFYDPSLFSDKYNNLYFSFSRDFPNKLSYDDGSRWLCGIQNTKVGLTPKLTEVRFWKKGVMIQKPAFALNDSSTMYFSIYEWLWTNGNHKPWIYKGVINDFNMQNLTPISYIPLESRLRNFDETMVVQLKNNHFFAMIRGIDGLYTSESNDGINWDSCTKFISLGATTSARFHLRRLKSGRLILIFNNDLTRTNLKAYLSDDEGKTWPYSVLIDNRKDVSYPDMVELDGNLYISYDFDRYGKGKINLVVIKESQILSGDTNFFRTIVDSLR